MSLCRWKSVFGHPGEGVHQYRIANLAVVDVIGTIAIACFIHWMFPSLSFLFSTALMFLLAIALHRVFCVRTTIDKWLFP